ncbi:hypothetical protein GCM10027187_64990 [Streptosporangium sandarakinum]
MPRTITDAQVEEVPAGSTHWSEREPAGIDPISESGANSCTGILAGF